MKIAIFHNFMDNIGGAEIFCLILAEELDATIYTTNIDHEKIRKMGFENIKIKSIGKVPLNAPLRHQLALRKFAKLNLKNKYDFYIIGGDWAISGAIQNKPNLWYVHSPIREIWDLYEYVRKNLVPFHLRKIFDVWVLYNRRLNKRYVEHVDTIICNSRNTQKRIKKYLNKDAEVWFPPIPTSKFKFKKYGDFWLSVNRLIDHKRIDMQLKAFQKLPNEKLIIVGSYEQSRHFKDYANYIKRIKPKNVEILSWIPESEVTSLYSNCKGLITTSKEEDFGRTPIEAMASGKPAIAPNEGGYKESIIQGKTGILIDDINEDKLIEAIKTINTNPKKYSQQSFIQAKKFDTKVFIKKMKEKIKYRTN